jgi:hypothetical protein
MRRKKMIDFNIGDRVRVKEYAEITDVKKAKSIKDKPYMWNQGKARLSGEEGVIVDKLYSEAYCRFVYRVHLDGYEKASHAQFDSDSLELIKEEPITYCHEFDYLDNVVVARFYEVKGNEKTEIMRGHGHIIHEGAWGIAQASAYALKKIWQKIEGESNE